MHFTPYLNFPGNCREAFEFYAKVFGGEIQQMITHGETPAKDHVPADWHDAIMHARLAIGDATLFGSDAPGDRYQKPAGMYISLHPRSAAEADRIFAELAKDGSVQMPIDTTFWAERFGMCEDRFGIPWMLNYEGSVVAA